jgi:hypothetical protein
LVPNGIGIEMHRKLNGKLNVRDSLEGVEGVGIGVGVGVGVGG